MPVRSRGALCPGMQMRAVGGRGKSPKSGSAGDTDRKSAHSLHVLEESPGWTCFVDGARGNRLQQKFEHVPTTLNHMTHRPRLKDHPQCISRDILSTYAHSSN